MSLNDFFLVAVWSLGAALVVGAAALLTLQLLRRTSLVVQILVLAFAAVASLVAGMFVVADQMYLSPHDYTVFLWVAATAGPVSIGLSVVLGLALVRNSRELLLHVRRVGDVEHAPSTVSGSLLPKSAPNEFAALARELAASDARLRESRERELRAESARRELVAWISHDLRTPLAGLHAMAEALQDGVVTDAERYHAQMAAQVDRLGGMVDDLFQLSTIHSGALHLSVRPVRSTEMLEDLVTELEPVAGARAVTLRTCGIADVELVADPDELTRAIANLVMNSIRLSPPETEIVLGARVDGEFAVVSVRDSAGGIAEADLGRVFDAGWRGTEARTAGVGSGVGGAGLGLAIVAGIVSAHRGRVTVANVDGGCQFDVFVPRAAG